MRHIQGLGIAVQAWYPLGGRGYTGALLGDPVIGRIAAAHGKSPAQVGAVDKPYPIFKLRDKIEEKTGWDGYADTDRR